MKKIYALKLFIGMLLIFLLISKADLFGSVLEIFTQLDYYDVAIVALMPAPLILMSCVKWQLLLSYRKISVRMISLTRYYIIGFFFNNFLPSSIGGDAARSYLVGENIGSQSESLAAVVLERLSGLFTLFALAAVGYALTPRVHDDPLVAGSILILAFGCIAIGTALWAPSSVIEPIETIAAKLPVVRKVMALFVKMRVAMPGFWNAPKVVFLTLLYSLGFHALTILNVFVTALVLGIDLSFVHLCVVTPIILAIAAIPTTPGGLGVWEWAYSILLLPIGATFEEGLAIALVLRGQHLFASMLGGFLYLLEKRQNTSLEET